MKKKKKTPKRYLADRCVRVRAPSLEYYAVVYPAVRNPSERAFPLSFGVLHDTTMITLK